MRQLFLRLYLLLSVAILGFGWSVDQLIDSYDANRTITSDIDIHRGTLFLVNKELSRIEPAEQETFLSAIDSSFGFNLRLVDANSLTLDIPSSQHLTEGGVVSVYNDDLGQSYFYQQLNNSERIIAIGPVYYQPRTTAWWSVLFFIFIALVVFIWLWPITKGLSELTRTAVAFGRGDFSVRAKTSATSPLISLTTRFNAMAERIARLVESHKELSHGVSHELRTPIARLRFAMEMVRDVPEHQQRLKYLDTMDTNIEELDALVDELLIYARFDREEPQLVLEQVDLVSVIEPQLERFIDTEPHLQINLYFAQAIECEIDKAAICRVVDNLVRNAVRYAHSQINVTLVLADCRAKILIDDDGPGIPEQSREELFKPFVRLDQSRDRKSGGIGLGLAIVKRLVSLHQGTIEVTANDAGGARFCVDIPLTRIKTTSARKKA